MPKIYLVKITQEDTFDFEIYITEKQSYTEAVDEAREYFTEDQLYSVEDEFELYDVTDLKINNYTLKALSDFNT